MKTLFVFSFLFVSTIQYVLADIVTTSTLLHYGKVTSITKSSVTIIKGCNNTSVTFPWDEGTSVIFNDMCDPPPGNLSGSPRIIEPKCINKTSVFQLGFRNVKSTFYCTSVSFDGNNFKFVLHDGRGFFIQDFVHNKNIDYLIYSKECTDYIKSPEQLPNFLQLVGASTAKVQDSPAQNFCIVQLKAPENNGMLNQYALQGGKVKSYWHFSWLPCQGAMKYQLYVIHPTALNPIINKDAIRTTEYLYDEIGYGPVTSLEGWTWKVRAYIGGQWGEWSDTRTFNVMPLPCTISGFIYGNLKGEYYSDVGGEHHTIVLETVALMTPDGRLVQKATPQGRYYKFDNVPSNKTYRIYPDLRFISDPPYIELINTSPRARYLKRNFQIRGVKPAE